MQVPKEKSPCLNGSVSLVSSPPSSSSSPSPSPPPSTCLLFFSFPVLAPFLFKSSFLYLSIAILVLAFFLQLPLSWFSLSLPLARSCMLRLQQVPGTETPESGPTILVDFKVVHLHSPLHSSSSSACHHHDSPPFRPPSCSRLPPLTTAQVSSSFLSLLVRSLHPPSFLAIPRPLPHLECRL